VLLNFQLYKESWRVAFLEADCKTFLPLKLHFKYAEKIKEMYRRHAETRLLEDEQALNHGLEIGRGGFWLRLNEEAVSDSQAKPLDAVVQHALDDSENRRAKGRGSEFRKAVHGQVNAGAQR
jgi:hypothetical protein